MNACVHKCMHAPGGGGCQALPLTSDMVKITSVYRILQSPSTAQSQSDKLPWFWTAAANCFRSHLKQFSRSRAVLNTCADIV